MQVGRRSPSAVDPGWMRAREFGDGFLFEYPLPLHRKIKDGAKERKESVWLIK